MKIAILIYSLAGGGAERVVSYLIPFIKKKGIEVHLVLMNKTISYDIPNDIRIHFIDSSEGSIENGLLKFLKIPWLAYKYSKLIGRLEVTHSLSLLTRPNYINILSKYLTKWKCKNIISERSHPSMQYGFKNSKSLLNNFLIKTLYKKVSHIICNSQGNANDLIKNYGISPSNIKVIHNPIDLDKIDTIKSVEIFFDKNYFNIITIGRLDNGKNQQLLIRAIYPFPNIRLYILGDGHNKENLKNLVEELNINERVFFLGFDNNPYKYLKGADLFLFGSNHEGFPNVLLEAMCCSLPILTTNCKSGPDEIMELKEAKTDDIMVTDYGILTPVNDLELMQKGLAYCLGNPEYLKRCRIRVKERIQDFKREPLLEAYIEVLLSH